MSHMQRTTQITTTKRPAELVRTYIEQEFFRPDISINTRLPTIHEFATHLNVSHSTVRAVLKTLSKEGKLKTIPGKGTFLTPEVESYSALSHNCIGVNMRTRSNEHGWGGSIFLGATEEALRANMMITTLDTALEENPSRADVHKAINRVDGIIAFPFLNNHTHELDHACEERKIPLVHVNPTHFHSTANFVSNDYFKFAYNLALAWRESERRQVVVILGVSVNNSVSAAQTVAAFLLAYSGCPDAQVKILEDQLPLNGEEGEGLYYKKLGHQLISQHIAQHGPDSVDAVYGFGDWTAEGAANALLEAGKTIPDEVSVVGGTGMNVVNFDFGPLVTMQQPMQKIGKAAIQMLLWRIQNHGFDTPGKYLMPELGKGATIRPTERKIYQRILKEEKELV